MKQTIALILVLILCISCAIGISADAAIDMASAAAENELEVIRSLAETYLAEIRTWPTTAYEILGFSKAEILGSSIGTPFKTIMVTRTGEVSESEFYSCPLIYSGELVGILSYNPDSETSPSSHGLSKSYAPELNALLKQSRFDPNAELVIASMDYVLFATDGTNIEIIQETPSYGYEPIDMDTIEDVCEEIHSSATSVFVVQDTSVLHSSVGLNTIVPPAEPLSYENPLSVPHVAQTGICGAAALASLLNYRFSTSYTNASLELAMTNGGYTHGTADVPYSMTDYRDYANDKHDAGCVFSGSVPSFSTVTKTIVAQKPILGSWYSGSGTDKVYHAILIIGFLKQSDGYYYYFKDPHSAVMSNNFISDASDVTCLGSSGQTWHLSQVVY